MTNLLFSPNDICGTPSSHPGTGQKTNSRTCSRPQVIPGITLPVPICVWKSPRPTELSNLARKRSEPVETMSGIVSRSAAHTVCP